MTHRRLLLALLIIALYLAPPISFAAPTFANAVTNGTVSISGLSEASGVVASRNNDNILWTHNDSGHAADVFAIDTQGRRVGTYGLPGNTDNEDISIGPGPVADVSYLHIGDIGDNAEARENIRVYQIPEPAVYSRNYTNPVTATLKGARNITLTYPDGPHNAESMFVDPLTGDLFVLTKSATTTRIYSATKSQLDAGNSVSLTFVGTITFNIASGAAISPSGNEIIVRQEEFARLWLRTNGQSISNAFAALPLSIPVTGTAAGEPNGEAIGFDAIGNGYFTLSDDSTSQPLRYFARTSNDSPPVPHSLVSAGSTWKYLDDGSNQGTAWRDPAFDPSGWSNGLAQFGYGDNDEKTRISYGGNGANKYITTYFRKSFVADNVLCITNLTLKLVVDDGAAVFLNGTPVVCANLATNAIYSTLSTPMLSALQDTWRSFSIDPKLLNNGTNVLACEVHLSSASATNVSFDLQLIAARIPCVTTLLRTNGHASIALSGPSNAFAQVQASQTMAVWTNIGVTFLNGNHGVFVDAEATNFERRFYRAKP